VSAPPGIHVPHVTEWFSEHVDGVEPPLEFSIISGGRSNLTYRVEDANGRSWAFRRPPLHSVLKSAHDMGREYRIIAALDPTDVPVPSAAGLCEDEEVNGAPFFVMDFLDGIVLRSAEQSEQELDADQRRAAGLDLVDTLALLHDVDPDEVGLGDLGRKEDYVARQLRRWHGQWEQVQTRELPLVDEVHARLSARIPEQQGATIAHGDYRMDNVILGRDGTIAGVVDWELCTLGDPLADLGTLLVYWSEPGDNWSALPAAPTAVEGFPTRDEVAERYAEQSGRDLSDLEFYKAFAYWRVACILEGVYSRYKSGAYGDTDEDVESFGERVPRLAEAAAEATERSGR
jgi:aminoglycoside phosphotransferase (APT) family kinase protein